MNKALVFFKEVKQEVSKIVWPKKQEAISATIFVGIMSLISAIYFLMVDQVIIFILKRIFSVNI